MGDAKAGQPPDVVGLTWEEAEERLAGWRVEMVVTAPPARGRASAGSEGSPESQAHQRSRVPSDSRVIRQVIHERGAVVLTVAVGGESGGKGPWRDGCGE